MTKYIHDKKHILLLFILTLFSASKGYCQPELDSFIASLNNKDLYITPGIGGLEGGSKKWLDTTAEKLPPRKLVYISSTNFDITQLAKKYTTQKIVDKLLPLLDDPQKDMYAAALLYDLLDNKRLIRLKYIKRDEWIKSGSKTEDARVIKECIKKENLRIINH